MIAPAEPRGLATDGAGLARAFDGAPVAAAIFDRELRLVRANGRFRSLTGCPGGMPSLLALHEIFPTSLIAIGPALTAARRGEPYPPLPVRFQRAGGYGATAEVTIAWLPDALQRGDQSEDGLLFVAAELDRFEMGLDAEVRLAAPMLADAPTVRRPDRLAPALQLPALQAPAPPAPPNEAARSASALPRALRHDLANVLNLVGNAAHMLLLRADDPDAVRTYAARIAAMVERGASLLGASGTEQRPAAPAGPGASEGSAASGAPARPATGEAGRNVLVVEDDDSSRDIMITVLERAGHRVHAVSGVAEALAALEARTVLADGEPAIEVLVTDIGLGDGSGWELAATARARWPQLRVGVVTGWDATADPGVSTDFVLRKPIRLPELIACVGGEL